MTRYPFTLILFIILILIPLNTMQTPISPEICIEPGNLHETQLNPCFLEPDTASCIKHIACKRHVSENSALTLKQNAEKLYAASQEPQPFSVYDGRAVWIACLASKGRLRPGPDSDCAACGSACTQESRLEVCELFCSWSTTYELSTDTLTLKAKEKTKADTTNVFIKESSSPLAKIKFMVIAIPCGLCAIILVLSSLLIIILLKPYMMKSKSQQENINRELSVPEDNFICSNFAILDLTKHYQINDIQGSCKDEQSNKLQFPSNEFDPILLVPLRATENPETDKHYI